MCSPTLIATSGLAAQGGGGILNYMGAKKAAKDQQNLIREAQIRRQELLDKQKIRDQETRAYQQAQSAKQRELQQQVRGKTGETVVNLGANANQQAQASAEANRNAYVAKLMANAPTIQVGGDVPREVMESRQKAEAVQTAKTAQQTQAMNSLATGSDIALGRAIALDGNAQNINIQQDAAAGYQNNKAAASHENAIQQAGVDNVIAARDSALNFGLNAKKYTGSMGGDLLNAAGGFANMYGLSKGGFSTQTPVVGLPWKNKIK